MEIEICLLILVFAKVPANLGKKLMIEMISSVLESSSETLLNRWLKRILKKNKKYI